MANAVYDIAKVDFANGGLDWDTNTIKVMALATGYTFSAAHTAVSSLTEISNGTGYTGGFNGSGRKTLSSCTVVQVDGSTRAELRVSNTTVWTAINDGTIKALAIIREMTSDADSIPIAYIDTFTGTSFPFVTNGGDLTITWNAAGALQFT